MIAYVKVAEDLKHLCIFLSKLISRQREASESASVFLIPITHNIKGFHVSRFAIGGPPGPKFNDMSHFGPFLRVSI